MLKAKSSTASAALAAALGAVLAGCAGSSSPFVPAEVGPPLPSSVTVNLGSHGGAVTLTYAGSSYSLNGRQVATGAEVQSSNGQTYRLTQDGAQWSAEYVPPDPWAVALGSSGEAILVTRSEDGTFRAGDAVFSNGGTVEASTGSEYALTLAGGVWRVEYAAPDPVVLWLGSSGEAVTLTRNEDASYAADGQPFDSGGVWQTRGGSTYRLTLVAGGWRHQFVASPTVLVPLGRSGTTLAVLRREDGLYEAEGLLLYSGDVRRAANGESYRLTLAEGRWSAALDPVRVTVGLGASGSSVTLERGEDGSYRLGGALFPSGSIHRAANGAEYRLTLAGNVWTATYVAAVIDVPVEGSSQTLALARLEDLSLWFEGRQVRSGDVVVQDGNEYQLLQTGGRWTARFRAGTERFRAGSESEDVYLSNGRFITIVKHEDGSYTWDGRTVRSGSVYTIDGQRYRLRLGNSEWIASRITVADETTGGGGGITGGDGGGGGETAGGGDPGGGSDLDGEAGGRAFFRIAFSPGVNFRSALRADATSPSLPERIALGMLPDARAALGDERAGWSHTGLPLGREGDHLVIDATSWRFFGEVSYGLTDLLGRGIVRGEITHGDWIIAQYETYIQRIKANLPLYGRDPASFDSGPERLVPLWEDTQLALDTVARNRQVTDYFGPFNKRDDLSARQKADLAVSALERQLDAFRNPEKIPAVFGVAGVTPAPQLGLGLTKSKLVFGSTADTRFGVYSNCCRYQGSRGVERPHWTTGHFAYSTVGAPRAADISRRGTATYTGDTAAVATLPGPASGTPAISLSPEPELYAGKISVTADFGSGRMTGTVTRLTREDDSSAIVDGEALTRIELPSAYLDDLRDPSAIPGAFSGAGRSRVTVGTSTYTESGASLEGHLVDGGRQMFGVWATTLPRTAGATITGAFGVSRSSGDDGTGPIMNPPALPDRMVLELLPPIDSLLTTSEARVGLDLGAVWGNWGGTVRLGTRGGRTEGTHLVVEAGAASFFGEVSYPLGDLLGRGVVRAEVTQGDWTIALYESYIATLKANLPLYERDPASFAPGEGPTSYVTLWRHIDNAIGTVASNWPRGLREGFSPYFDHEDATPREQAELLVAHLERRLDALKNPAKIPDVFPRPGYTGPELRIGLDLAKSKLVFGSTADTRFGAYSVCCRIQVRPHELQPRDVVQPHWTSGHFAYSRIGAPAAADIPRSGTATYTGDTVAAVVPPGPLPTASLPWQAPEAGGAILLSPEPELYAGTITVTANFGTRQVTGAVTDLTDGDDAALTIQGRPLTRIDLPTARLEDLSNPSSTPGKFAGTGPATIFRGSSSTQLAGGTFEGHLVDAAGQGFGVWATTLPSTGSVGETISGAFGANRTATTGGGSPSP